MIRFTQLWDAAKRVEYHRNDFHTELFKRQSLRLPRLFGELASILAVPQIASIELFDALLTNRRLTGERLTMRTNTTRRSLGDSKLQIKRNRRAGVDLTASPPKSVSLAIVLCGSELVLDALLAANDTVLRQAEKLACVRIRADQQSGARRTGNFLAFTFLHFRSRSNDPQVHPHNIIANATAERDGTIKALEAEQIFAHAGFLDALFTAELHYRMRELGLGTIVTAEGFELAEFPVELLRRFSRRGVRLEKTVEKATATGKRLSATGIKLLALTTRKPKKTKNTLSAIGLRRSWKRRAHPWRKELKEFTERNGIASKGEGNEVGIARTTLVQAANVFDPSRPILTQRALFARALRQSRGQFSLTHLELAFASACTEGVFQVSATTGILTSGQVRMQRRTINIINAFRNRLPPLCPKLRHGVSASTDHSQILNALWKSRDLVIVVRSDSPPARLSEHIVDSVKGQLKLEVIEGPLPLDTMDRIIANRHLLVLNHCSPWSIEQLSNVVATAAERDLRVILIDTVPRQTRTPLTGIVEDSSVLVLFSGFHGASAKQSVSGELRVALTKEDRNQQIATEFLKAWDRGNDVRTRCIAVATAENDVAGISSLVHAALVEAGRIKNVRAVPRLSVVHHSPTPSKPRVGDIVIFRQRSGQFRRGERATVVDVGSSKLVAKRADDSLGQVKLRGHKLFDVFRVNALEIGIGEQLLLPPTRRSEPGGRVCGDLVFVANSANGVVRLTDGQRLEDEAQQLHWGYCVPYRKKRLPKVDKIFVAASDHDTPKALQRLKADLRSRAKQIVVFMSETLSKALRRHRRFQRDNRQMVIQRSIALSERAPVEEIITPIGQIRGRDSLGQKADAKGLDIEL